MKKLLGLGLIGLCISSYAQAQSQQQAIQGIMGMMQQMAIEAQRQQQLRGQVPIGGAIGTLSTESVQAIQYWLVWTGHYPGPIDGDLGQGTKEAIRRFQREIGHPPTGALTNQQADILAEKTSRSIKQLEYSDFTDPISGVQIGIPESLVPLREGRASGTDFYSSDGRTRIGLRYLSVNRPLSEVYDLIRSAAAQGTIEYSVLRNDWFVVSGRHDETSYYIRYAFRDGAIAGFFAIFGSSMEEFKTPLTVTSLTMQAFARVPAIRSGSGADFSSVVEPFERIPGYPTARTSSASVSAKSVAVWTHNGSTMRLIADGARRSIEYVLPRPDLASAGVKPGTVLFSGQRIGNRIEGRAYTFKKGCAPEPYGVQGVITSETQIVLKGLTPIRRNGCQVTEKSASHPDSVLAFSFVGPDRIAGNSGPQGGIASQIPAPSFISPITQGGNGSPPQGSPNPQQPPSPSTSVSQAHQAGGAVQSQSTAVPPQSPVLTTPVPPASQEEVDSANLLLADVQTFVRSRAPIGQVTEIALAVASVQTAVETKSSIGIREESTKLRDLLLKLDGFVTFEAERSAARSAEKKKVLDSLAVIAKKNMTFIERRIAENVTAPTVRELARIRNETDAAISSGDAQRLQSAIRQLGTFVDQQGLADAYATFMDAENPTKDASAPRPSAALAAKARFLSEGDPEDVIILYNASPTAPHVAKNLEGLLAYEKNQASVCAASASAPETLVPQLLLSGVFPSDVRASVDSNTCSFSDNSRHDLFVLSVNEFRQLPSFKAERLSSAIERDELRHLRTMRRSELNELERNRQTRAMEIETKLENGSLNDGFGTLIINPQLTIGCAVGVDDEDVHRRLLDQKYEHVFFRARRDFSLAIRSPDAAFLGVQRKQCGFVYGSGAQLTRMIASLRRDGRVYEVSPYWLGANDVQEATRRTEADRKAQRDREKQQEAQREIDSLRGKQSGQERSVLQKKLRQENGDRANGFKSQFNTEMRRVLEGNDSKLLSSTFFPDFYRSTRERRANQWELVKLETEVEDYGTVLWKGRKVEGVLIHLSLNEKNRILGEYKDYCFVLGLVSDEEFQMFRDPVESDCKAGMSRIQSWKVNNSFSSKWNVN